MNTTEQFHVDQVSPSYWRVTFDNGPVNLLDPDTVDQLGALIGRIEDDPDLTVVVFRSDKPGYFMAHWDFLADNARVAGMRPGPAVLGQFEVGDGAVPGGGPMTRLGAPGRPGRALEILLGGDDIPAGLAAEYGYVNGVIPDAEIEDFTDAFARRIAAFGKAAVTGIKKLVDMATLPADEELEPGLKAYFATAGRPENRPFVQLLLVNGICR
jgi:enoyl-CoA hydratase/carnithine racemase